MRESAEGLEEARQATASSVTTGRQDQLLEGLPPELPQGLEVARVEIPFRDVLKTESERGMPEGTKASRNEAQKGRCSSDSRRSRIEISK